MMYTGSYNGDGEMRIPEGYDGTMLNEDTPCLGREAAIKEEQRPPSILSGILRGGNALFNIPILKELNIGIEEILIGATALFLLTSHGGDKECALMLLLLLFIR